MFLLYFSFFSLSRIVTEKPHQGSVNKLLYCIVLDCIVLSWISGENRSLGTYWSKIFSKHYGV